MNTFYFNLVFDFQRMTQPIFLHCSIAFVIVIRTGNCWGSCSSSDYCRRCFYRCSDYSCCRWHLKKQFNVKFFHFLSFKNIPSITLKRKLKNTIIFGGDAGVAPLTVGGAAFSKWTLRKVSIEGLCE